MQKIILFFLSALILLIFCETSSTDDGDADNTTIKCTTDVSGDITADLDFIGSRIDWVQLQPQDGNHRSIQCWSDSDNDCPRIRIYVDEWYSATAAYDLTVDNNNIRYSVDDNTDYESDTDSTDCTVIFTTSTSGTFKCTNLVRNAGEFISLANGTFEE